VDVSKSTLSIWLRNTGVAKRHQQKFTLKSYANNTDKNKSWFYYVAFKERNKLFHKLQYSRMIFKELLLFRIKKTVLH
jgi:hypothetical protein